MDSVLHDFKVNTCTSLLIVDSVLHDFNVNTCTLIFESHDLNVRRILFIRLSFIEKLDVAV